MLKTHILIQDQQLLKKSALKLTPPLPHSPHRAHSGVAGMSMGDAFLYYEQ